MRRWNGWGDDEIEEPLPSQGAEFLAAAVGHGTALPDASLNSVLSQVPASRAPQTAGLDHEPLVRVLHARGQSLPDWVALRAGRLGVVPDAVAHPANSTDVAQLIRLAAERRWTLIPYGGGTSVVGHVNPLPSEAPIVTVDLGGLNRLQSLDEASMLATFEAGVRGPDLEAALRARGFTLGHFPQSF